jgi:hypothetical protein
MTIVVLKCKHNKQLTLFNLNIDSSIDVIFCIIHYTIILYYIDILMDIREVGLCMLCNM